MQPRKPNLIESPFDKTGEGKPANDDFVRKSSRWPPIIIEDRRTAWVSAALSVIASLAAIGAAVVTVLVTIWHSHMS